MKTLTIDETGEKWEVVQERPTTMTPYKELIVRPLLPKKKSLEEEVKAEWKAIAGDYGGPSSSQIVLMRVLDRRLKAIEEKIK